MAIGNEELVHLCFSKHLRMGTARIKDTDTVKKHSQSIKGCRLISVQPLIGLTIWAFSIGSVLWVLEVLCSLYWQSFCQTDHSILWWMVVGVNWLTLFQEYRRGVFWATYSSSCTLQSFFTFWKIS